MINCEIIICTEKGRLEYLSKLLISSLRNFGGKYKDLPIYSYAPRREMKPERETLRFFENYNVVYVNEEINENYSNYPLANKPLCCAYHEKNSKAEYLLFLDSDTLFLQEPTQLFCDLDYDIKINPTDYSNIGTDLEFRKNEGEYWEKLYKLLKIKRRKEVKCTVDKEQILEYYNSGLVLVKKSKKIFSNWENNFINVWQEGLSPIRGNFFIEQSVLSATIAQMELNIGQLGPKYNYPITSYSKKWKGLYPYSLKKIHHIHYHKLFQKEAINTVHYKISKTPNGKLINELIQEILL